MFLGGCSRWRILPEKPACEPGRIFEANTAVAEIPVFLREELLLRGVLQIDAVAARTVELILSEGTRWSGQLPHVNLRLTRGDCFPVYAVRRNDAPIRAPGSEDLITLADEVRIAVLQHARRNDRLREV